MVKANAYDDPAGGDLIGGQASGSAGAPLLTPKESKVLVIVHGAGIFPNDYFKPFVAEIERRLGHPFAYLPAYYADILDSPGRFTAMRAEAPGQVMEFQAAFQKELEDAYASIPQAERPASITSFALSNEMSLISAITKEVSLYLFDTFVTSGARARVTATLAQAAQQFDEIVFFSHSLGTVVSFDVLHDCASQYGKISYWLTTGCPLGKLRRLDIRSDDLGQITAANVRRWYNLYDTTDIVSDAIGPEFPKPGYRLHDIFIDVAMDPIHSHDYMTNKETLDLVADLLR